ncbi:hypothetical protein EK21DRAFT_67420 [Setomelanomma holmii]|uniref:DNA 3'-5' helicase n=1 Tax=Setomelanomma holmii TaxID=210430 RepID=A0A9P4H8M9_9PLEO|nr:hypothetical protein EK21DRAFT_67420 [Setomelanomma holmii]
MARTASATVGGVSMKHLSLVTLTFQNSALILIMHYSRVMPLVNGQRYHTSTSVFLNEVIKLGISLTMALFEMSQNLPSNTTLATLFSILAKAILSNESWKLGIPAILYTIQNTLQYVAVSNLDAATFQVTYQLKILTTAIFSVLMLGRSLSSRKWISLLLLIVGVSIIQVPQNASAPASSEAKAWPRTFEELRKLGSIAAHRLARSASYEGIDADSAASATHMNSRIGLLAVISACALSGLAGVTFEKILKNSSSAKDTTLWVRNCQLSFWSLFPSLFLGVIWNEGEAIAQTGFFAGYNWVVWLAILFQAAGGVIVALVINYADNIAKNFATSVSIVLSCIASAYFFDFKVTPSFFIGTCVVLSATYLYTKPDRAAAQSQVHFASLEKTVSSPALHYRDASLKRSHGPIPGTPTLDRGFQFEAAKVPVMDDDAYHQLESQLVDRSRLPILQPQFRQSTRPAPARDRYRASQYQGAVYDDVEDHDLYERDDRLRYDSFDERVLQHSYPDQQQQAEQGRDRLSLAPAPSKFYSNVAQSQSEVSYQPRDFEVYDDSGELIDGCRFAYNAKHPLEPSSDAQLGLSSSPALRADQRRAEHSVDTIAHHSSRARLLENERQYARGHQSTSAGRTYQGFTKPEPQEIDPSQVVRNVSMHHKAPADMQIDTARPQPRAMNLPHAPPMCQGIRLVPVSTLPDRLRTVFPYPAFNAVQSKCFDSVFRSDDNFVLSSPTGSGKTVILELAICRAIATNTTGQYKIVYQAPTKALCSERQRDWAAKFTPLGLKCVELTGDSDASDVRNVQSANIIVTTPEKWDSITRKWKDHEKLMRLIKVFLIDEVHILKEDRGAVLEAVVSRMKSIGTDVRFVALSATVPNLHDVATWLGRSPAEPCEPAAEEKFGEEFRPVKLRKHVCGYSSQASNDFGFEKVLDAKLTAVVSKYSEGKPIMVFCATRASCLNTAKILANWWMSRQVNDRKWQPPTKQLSIRNKDLRDTVGSGVAFHHAGLDLDDRTQVEKGFLGGDINVICCTSTLAVGVNLPCHLVVVKNTMTYTNEGLHEYADLEMMQMLGRAGRPQFDDSAVAVIMTRQTKVRHYEMMVTGQELLESKLHLNLIDHINAEIGLGTIRDLASARKWLTGTFLYVRLEQNPSHYKIEGKYLERYVDEHANAICSRDIALLKEHNLVFGDENIRCTEFGHAMARYYVHFETMKVFMGIQTKATPSEILSAIAQASDFNQLRFRAGEKTFYKTLNKSPSTRFSIPVNLDLPAHKVSLIIQAILGAADISWDGENAKFRSQFTTETAIVFKKISSLIRCIIDCQIYLGDSVSIHSALMLERSLGSRVWDDSPLQMKQIDGIGPIAVRKLVNAGVRSMEDLEGCDARRIETLLSRNPPFGMKVLELARTFPKLRVSLHAQPSSVTKCPEGVKIQVKADIGFNNEKPPQCFAGKPVYVCVLAETSDGRKIHFARIRYDARSGMKLGPGQSLIFPALLTSVDQCINCYVMCDSIGDLRGATVKPQIVPFMFPALKAPGINLPQRSNTSKRRAEPVKPARKRSTTSDDFGDDEIDDDALVKASFGDFDFEHIENFANPTDAVTRKNKSNHTKGQDASAALQASNNVEDEPLQLATGKWACNHPCKDKQACKHLCCKEGMDKPSKKTAKAKRRPSADENMYNVPSASTQRPKQTQSKLQLTTSKRKFSSAVEELDLTQQEKKQRANYAKNGPKNYRELHQLHKTIQKKDPPLTLLSVMHKKPAYCYSQGGGHNLSFMPQPTGKRPGTSSDYGDIQLDELSSHLESSPYQYDPIHMNSLEDANQVFDHRVHAADDCRASDKFGDDDSLLGDAMVGLADSQGLQDLNATQEHAAHCLRRDLDMDFEAAFMDEDLPFDLDMHEEAMASTPQALRDEEENRIRNARRCELPAPYNSYEQPNDLKPVRTLLRPDKSISNKINHAAAPSRQPANKIPQSQQENTNIDVDVLDLTDAFDDDDDDDTMSDQMQPSAQKQDQKNEHVAEVYKDLEPWLFKEFGDIVELVE